MSATGLVIVYFRCKNGYGARLLGAFCIKANHDSSVDFFIFHIEELLIACTACPTLSSYSTNNPLTCVPSPLLNAVATIAFRVCTKVTVREK